MLCTVCCALNRTITQVVIITGANAGIGLETAKALVAMGADVIMGKQSFTFQ
jgi:NADP-dependent 3-hydroxy acid dehydrogenase YdfG